MTYSSRFSVRKQIIHDQQEEQQPFIKSSILIQAKLQGKEKKKMNNNKVHSHRTVPAFSWEEKPGVSKVLERKTTKTEEEYCPTDDHDRAQTFEVKLPPPPGPPEKYRASFHDFQIPPPPCAFQPPSRSSSRRRNDDPFLIAYKECTKSSRKDHKLCRGANDHHRGFGLKKNMSVFSCKRSCSVVDDSIIKTSQLPISRSKRESHED